MLLTSNQNADITAHTQQYSHIEKISCGIIPVSNKNCKSVITPTVTSYQAEILIGVAVNTRMPSAIANVIKKDFPSVKLVIKKENLT